MSLKNLLVGESLISTLNSDDKFSDSVNWFNLTDLFCWCWHLFDFWIRITTSEFSVSLKEIIILGELLLSFILFCYLSDNQRYWKGIQLHLPCVRCNWVFFYQFVVSFLCETDNPLPIRDGVYIIYLLNFGFPQQLEEELQRYLHELSIFSS